MTTGLPPLRISLIIPARNEAENLSGLLPTLTSANFAEIIVVDNGSSDDTPQIVAANPGVVLARSAPGRGPAMNAGAALSSGDVLFFLHADSRLPADALAAIRAALSDAHVIAGCFRLAFDRTGPTLSLSAWMTRFDTPVTTFGDQGYFIRRSAFEQLGGFAPWPILEDVDMRRRLQRLGIFRKLDLAITTSARRFARHGPLRQQLRNCLILALYGLGMSPHRLARLYRPHA
ncbi:MAG: TIGR04283 family arsenosugar biosynthesis glycosyltransferase [Hyphomicrobiales bacterium]|nr:TIGR04283 family arsenosugar biosynthesis glycosyltransferase [Hyphomicrobiales bacterium]